MAIPNSQGGTGNLARAEGGFMRARKPRLTIGRFSVAIPASRPLRVGLGLLLILCGLVGFLPVLGFWMIPLGIMVLSIDIGPVRRLRRRVEIWWAKRRRNRVSRSAPAQTKKRGRI
jgi:hypothetical protein